MKIKRIFTEFLFFTIDLVINITFVSKVFDLNAKALEKGHFEIAVHALTGVIAHSKAADLAVFFIICICKKVG